MQSFVHTWTRFMLGLAFFGFAAQGEARFYESFADVASRAIPGVVNIRTTQYVMNREGFVDPYQFFLKGGVPRPQKNHSLGSGVLLDNQGYIVTNSHVVSGASEIQILFAESKKKVLAKVIGSDRKTDVALLKIAPQAGLQPLDLGDSDKLRVGDIVLAIGNPFGFSHTVTSGIISAKGRVIGAGPYDSFLQTDAAIHPGNSGGPLIDIRGRVIGINTAVSAEGAGIGFAIPINMVKDVVADLKKHGKVNRPWLGIVGRNIISADEVSEGADSIGVYGVLVENLVVDGPAHGAGLQIGDLVMGVNKDKVFDTNMLQRLLTQRKPTDKVVLKVYRRGRGFLNVSVSLSVVPKTQELPQEKDLF